MNHPLGKSYSVINPSPQTIMHNYLDQIRNHLFQIYGHKTGEEIYPRLIELIENANPNWRDLYPDLLG